MEPIGDSSEDADFADEHDDTTVDPDVSDEARTDGEPETPEGWAGLEREGPP